MLIVEEGDIIIEKNRLPDQELADLLQDTAVELAEAMRSKIGRLNTMDAKELRELSQGLSNLQNSFFNKVVETQVTIDSGTLKNFRKRMIS